jgi:hypothetical protein
MPSFSFAQMAKSAPPPQTPRQALLEVLKSGGSKAVLMRHLPEATKAALGSDGLPTLLPFETFGNITLHANSSADMNGVQFFEAGPVLMRAGDPADPNAGVIELRIDNDDLNGDQDDMQLSLIASGNEPSMAFVEMPQLGLHMKQEQGIWRFEEVDLTMRYKLGDPAFIKSMADFNQESNQMFGQSAVEMASAMEQEYAQQHPEEGFTCSIDKLSAVGAGKESMPDTLVKFAEQRGYKLQLNDCSATTFKIAAVSENKNARIYCTDQSGKVRFSTDGSAQNCFANGKPAESEQGTGIGVIAPATKQ